MQAACGRRCEQQASFRRGWPVTGGVQDVRPHLKPSPSPPCWPPRRVTAALVTSPTYFGVASDVAGGLIRGTYLLSGTSASTLSTGVCRLVG